MDQPELESMTTSQAADAIEAMLGAPETPPEIDEVEEPEEPAEDEPDAVSDDEDGTEAEPEQSEQEPQIQSIADLAEALEIPVEELTATLTTKIKVNGQELEVTLAELAQGYQKDADYRQKTSELATQRKAFSDAYQAVNQRLNQEFQQVGQIMTVLEKMVVKAPDPSEMEYLRQTDPSAFLLKKAEFEDQAKNFAQLKQAAMLAQQQHAAQLAQLQEAQRTEILRKAMEDLPNRVSDWSPSKKQALDEYLTSERYGYSPEELAQITDPRLVELVNKAYLYDTMQKKVDVTKEKVKALPKVQKPAPLAVKTKVSNLDKAKAALRKTGHINDAAAAIQNLLR